MAAHRRPGFAGRFLAQPGTRGSANTGTLAEIVYFHLRLGWPATARDLRPQAERSRGDSRPVSPHRDDGAGRADQRDAATAGADGTPLQHRPLGDAPHVAAQSGGVLRPDWAGAAARRGAVPRQPPGLARPRLAPGAVA